MSKVIHYKFKSELNQHQIPFEGSHISVHELTEAIRKKHNNTQYDLVVNLKDSISNKEKICSPNDFIPAYSFVTIRRLPLSNPIMNFKNKKTINIENFNKIDPYKNMNQNGAASLFNKVLDTSAMTEEEKVENIIETSAMNYRFTGKVVPRGIPPSSYVCNKCNISGHWINYCPGIPDKNGKLVDSRTVKRPSGIPSCGLMEVDENTPNSYLTPDGRYVVNVKNRDALLKGKKDKRPFSIEENPPLVANPENDIPKEMKCKLCSDLIVAPTQTRCCDSKYCRICITDYLFDPEKSVSMHKCPNCFGKIDKLDDLIEDSNLENLIFNWNVNKSQNKFIKPTNLVKTEEKLEVTDDDLANEIFFLENKENENPYKENSVYQSKPSDNIEVSSNVADDIEKLASENCVQGIIELMKSNPKAIQVIQGIVNNFVSESNVNNQKSRSRSRPRHISRNYDRENRDHNQSSRHYCESRHHESQRSSRRYREDSSHYSPHRRSKVHHHSRNFDEYKSGSKRFSREKADSEQSKYRKRERNISSRSEDENNNCKYSENKKDLEPREIPTIKSPVKDIRETSEISHARQLQNSEVSDKKSKSSKTKSHKKHKKSHRNEEDKKKHKKSKH